MQPTYQELFAQDQILIKRLDEALVKIEQLEFTNKALQSKIKDLEDKLNTNSSNSSKSPSQDPFRKGKKAKPSGLKQGAQKGHQGHSRQLIPLEEVKIIHDLKPDICPECQSNTFDSVIIGTDIRQVIELPEIPLDATQYNIHTCRVEVAGNM